MMFGLMASWAVVLCLVGAGSALLEQGGKSPLALKDSSGRTVYVETPVQRLIVLNPEAAEAVKILGCTDLIAGVVEDLTRKSYLPELRGCRVVGTWREYDFEEMARIATADGKDGPEGTAVISYASFAHGSGRRDAFMVEEGLSPFQNLTVVGLDFFSPERLEEEMTVLGRLLQREGAAREFIEWNREAQARVDAAVHGQAGDRAAVYFEGSSRGGLGELWTFGNGSAIDRLAVMAKGRNVARGLDGSSQVQWEWVVAQDPDVIVRLHSTDQLGWAAGNEEVQSIRREIMERPGSEGLSAVRDGRVYVASWEMFFGLDGAVGLGYLARVLHPQADLDPEQVQREYLGILGLEYPPGNRVMDPWPGL
ncbi:MAG: ABC transporter substrate-binding protein [Methanosarcinales archaeon]|nr:ABC transporter substrate-binding protein [Methanosarcinales archaeon]